MSGLSALFFACSGGSSVGQIANEVCRQLSGDGYGKMCCLAGIGAQVSGLTKSARGARVVAIDGCGWTCARKVLETAKIPISHHLVLSDWGFEDKPDLFPRAEEVLKAKRWILAIIE